MSAEWQTVRIGDLGKVVTGKTPSTAVSENFGGNYPFITIPDLDGRREIAASARTLSELGAQAMRSCRLPAGAVMMSCIATIGKCGITTRASFTNQQINSLICKDGVDPKFVYYSFSQLGRALEAAGGGGSVYTNVSKSRFESIEIKIPSLQTQKVIVAILAKLDDKIDINCRINQTLETMAQAIFKSWFVDFVPVQAKIAAKQEGRDALRAAMTAISGKPGIELDTLPPEQYDSLAATAALFPDEMEESELGDIPRGWACGALGDICSFTAGSAFKPEHQGSTEGDYPFIKVSDMNLAGNEVFIQSANNYVSKAQQSEMKAKLHPLGATVFAKIGVALISNRRRLLTSPTIIDNNLMSASPVEGKSGQYFLYSLLSTLDFNTLVSGTALPYINVSDLKKIPIVRPPSEACRAFEAKASSIFSMMQTLAAQSSTLAITRDALLPKLLSGEIEASGTLEG